MFLLAAKKKTVQYRVISGVQVGLTAARTVGTATACVQQIIFSQFFFLFSSLDASPRGALRISGKQTHCFKRGQSLSAYCLLITSLLL